MKTNDLTIYEHFADEWWVPEAPHFRSLQALTPFRLKLINSWIGSVAGKKILDLGCGGGLLSLPLLAQGAHVVGVDLSAASIAQAQKRAEGKGEFHCGDICSLSLIDNAFDVVLMADVLDHIPDYVRALTTAYQHLRPGGVAFVGTINRTTLSRLFSLTLGEGLGYIPKGTHEYTLFIRPQELISAAQDVGFTLVATQGEFPCIFKTIFSGAIHLRRSSTCTVAYSLLLRRPHE